MFKNKEKVDAKEQALAYIQMYQAGFTDGYYHKKVKKLDIEIIRKAFEKRFTPKNAKPKLRTRKKKRIQVKKTPRK